MVEAEWKEREMDAKKKSEDDMRAFEGCEKRPLERNMILKIFSEEKFSRPTIVRLKFIFFLRFLFF